MSGPPPKDPAQRRRRNAPARGDWVELEPLNKPVLGRLPRRETNTGVWSTRARETWKAWRQDPVAQVFTPADIAMTELLIFQVDELAKGRHTLANAVMSGMKQLGLSPEGKRALRFRVADADRGAAQEPGGLVSIEGGRAQPARQRILGA